MSGDYKVSRCTRRCHAQDRPLREGEWFYSAVVESGHDYLRRDYAAEAWEGPPEGTVGWWKNRMPTAGEKKRVLAPKEVLIDLLVQMAEHPSQAKLRYLLALLLMRRRLVRPVEAASPAEPQSPEAAPPLRVEVIGQGTRIDVPVSEIGRGESAALRAQLDELIHREAED